MFVSELARERNRRIQRRHIRNTEPEATQDKAHNYLEACLEQIKSEVLLTPSKGTLLTDALNFSIVSFTVLIPVEGMWAIVPGGVPWISVPAFKFVCQSHVQSLFRNGMELTCVKMYINYIFLKRVSISVSNKSLYKIGGK